MRQSLVLGEYVSATSLVVMLFPEELEENEELVDSSSITRILGALGEGGEGRFSFRQVESIDEELK